MKKNKFRIFPMMTIATFFLMLLSIPLFILIPLDELTIFYIIIYISMLLVLPILLFVISLFMAWPIIEFNTKGLTKTLFNIKLKEISWDEIVDIHRINTGLTEWVFFSKINLKGKSIAYCRWRKDNIYIVSTPEIESIISEFAPKM